MKYGEYVTLGRCGLLTKLGGLTDLSFPDFLLVAGKIKYIHEQFSDLLATGRGYEKRMGEIQKALKVAEAETSDALRPPLIETLTAEAQELAEKVGQLLETEVELDLVAPLVFKQAYDFTPNELPLLELLGVTFSV